MSKKINSNRWINILNLFSSIIVSSTGLILFTRFHMGDGAYREAWLGFGKKGLDNHSLNFSHRFFHWTIASYSTALAIYQDTG
jgi:hypothetical protein